MRADLFAAAMQKHAVSMGRTLAALRGRVAQGARVAPAVLQHIEAQAAQGLSSTPRAARTVALNAADSVAARRKMHQALSNPVTQQAHQRVLAGYAAAVERRPGVFNRDTPLSFHYDYGAAGNTMRPVAYTPEHVSSLAGSSQLVDPKGLMAPRIPKAPRLPSPNGTAVTAVDRTPRRT